MDAVLWDMDGLLVDTEPLWTVAEQELAASVGRTFTPAMKASIVGARLDVAVPLLLEQLGAATDPVAVERTAGRLLARMVELFASPLVPRPGAVELLAALRAEGVPVALVSSSYRVLVDAVLASGAGPFDLTVAGDEVLHGKPHPEPYLTAARRLLARPDRCVVLEDSPAGVAAGEAAGCAVVAVPSVPGSEVLPRLRRLVVPSLAAVGPDDLRALVGQRAA